VSLRSRALARDTLVLIVTLIVASPASLRAQAATDSVERSASGAFTDDQATRGSASYQAYCESCHEQGYHTSDKFRQKWFGRTVYELFTTLRTTMPDDNPGGLTDEEYARITAYILKLNGFVAGTDSLPADSLRMSLHRISP
jgi:mono/diheme cytochrome c family protein